MTKEHGGFMSVRLAIELSDKIAAVAPVTAQLSVALSEQTPELPISIMIVNGTEDPIVPFASGDVRLFEFGRSRGEVLSTTSAIEKFRQHNGCGATPKIEVRFRPTDSLGLTQIKSRTGSPGP